MFSKKNKNLTYIFIGAVLVTLMTSSFFVQQSVLTVGAVTIDPTGSGYIDPLTNEWTGDFWSIVMSTDLDDQICAMMLQNEDGTPEGTFAVTGNYDGVSDKTYTSTTSVGGNILVPTSQIMVHILPQKPYYERAMEIQSGTYIKEAYGRDLNSGARTSQSTSALTYNHYSFADVGGGNWILHTPFTVNVYKDGALIGSRDIDSIGTTSVYRIPENTAIDEFIRILDLGKLDVSGYGEPQWDDIIYFDANNIFVRTPTADTLLQYDAGVNPIPIYNPSGEPVFGGVNVECFSTFWFGPNRWVTNDEYYGTPTVLSTSQANIYSGWTMVGSVAVPQQADIYNNIIPYLQSKNVQRVAMPTGFDSLEKVYYDGDSDGDNENYLRVYFEYGTKSSLITVQVSTQLADTIVWQPQVAKFDITSFPNFGDVINTKTVDLTVACLEGSGSGIIKFTKTPADTAISITPQLATPSMTAGDTYTVTVDIQNLGTETTKDFSVTATVYNYLGSVTDSATASGTLFEKTGATSVVHVITEFEGKPISNLPVTIEYAGSSQTSTTGIGGTGTATFSLGTSADVSVTASFAGNDYYKPVSKTMFVKGATEETITLVLSTEGQIPLPPDPPTDWGLILGSAAVGLVAVMFVVMWRRTKKRR